MRRRTKETAPQEVKPTGFGRSSQQATAHKLRCKNLPPLKPGERERLLAEFLAVKSVTSCPPRYAAPSGHAMVGATATALANEWRQLMGAAQAPSTSETDRRSLIERADEVLDCLAATPTNTDAARVAEMASAEYQSELALHGFRLTPE
jgi:hypothetical protein